MADSDSSTNATIVRRVDLHAGLFFIWVALDTGDFPPFHAGQYVSVGRKDPARGGMVERHYSIGSSAHRRDHVELFVVHVDDGAFSSWLVQRREGARLWMSPEAIGSFTLQSLAPHQDLILVATGTGVAPYFSMYRTWRDAPPWRRVVLINGARYAADLGYRSELENVAADDERFTYLPLVTREPKDSPWRGMRGRVGDVLVPERFATLTGFSLDPSECHVYLCGNPAMVDETELALTALGFQTHTEAIMGNLHVEKYWTDEP